MTNHSKIINRQGIKAYILDYFDRNRPWCKITRVSKDALDLYEERLRLMIVKDIESYPSAGKTFKP